MGKEIMQNSRVLHREGRFIRRKRSEPGLDRRHASLPALWHPRGSKRHQLGLPHRTLRHFWRNEDGAEY